MQRNELVGSHLLDELRAPSPCVKRESVYLVKSDYLPFVKLGRWSGTLSALQARYKVVYGPDTSFYTFAVENSKVTEKMLKERFASRRVCGELYRTDDGTCLMDYVRAVAEAIS